jgi:hypothetical protein
MKKNTCEIKDCRQCELNTFESNKLKPIYNWLGWLACSLVIVSLLAIALIL